MMSYGRSKYPAYPHTKTGAGLFNTKRMEKEIEDVTKKDKPSEPIFSSKKNEEIYEKIEKEVLKVEKKVSSVKITTADNTTVDNESESEGSGEEEEEDEQDEIVEKPRIPTPPVRREVVVPDKNSYEN